VIAVGTTTTRALESAARRAEEQERGGAEGQRSRGVEELRSRGAEEQRGRGAEEQRSRAEDSPPLGPSAPQPLCSSAPRPITPGTATTDLFIYPGFEFRVIDGLVTNFHLPCSSLLMLVSAFGERELILGAYRHAIDREYRFYSYGDAMFIL